MKKSTQVVLTGVLFLSTIIASAQISTRTGGSANVLANSPTTNTNVGIGTNTPKSNLDVKGNLTVGSTYGGVTAAPTNGLLVEGKVGIGTTTPKGLLDINGGLANGQTFTDYSDSYTKSLVLNIGSVRSTSGGRMFTFFDIPSSNINSKSFFVFKIEDRNDANRFKIEAEADGYTDMMVSNKRQEVLMRTHEDGNDNVYMDMPKPNSRIVIGGWGDYLLEHKLVVRGSAKIEGNILTDANIGIGTSNFVDGADTYRLSVKGKIRAEEIKVYNTWADYVFKKEYKLTTLNEVEKFIIQNGHLPNVPSAEEVTEKGLELGEMAKIQQEKIEELTLYIIAQNKRIEALEQKINNK
jgi:hypothetical protein